MKKISFVRGDTFAFKFQRKDCDEQPILEQAQKVWFTVKKNYNTNDKMLQKTLDDGITFTDDGYYHVIINSKDTRELKYGDFVYDIQIMNAHIVQTIAKGTFSLETEVTTDYE